MALVTFTDSPKTTDTILFQFPTPDANGCFAANPYKVDNFVVYFVERDFLGTNYGQWTTETVDPTLKAAVDAAQAAYCADPTINNLTVIQIAQGELDSKSQKTTFYYNDRIAVLSVGTPDFPAWLSSDLPESWLTQAVDDRGNPIIGLFTYEWSPKGAIRPGDYFLCWTWTPHPAGTSLSNAVHFRVEGDPSAVTTIPTHVTVPGKYEMLLERYLPDMYKTYLSDNDMSPETLQTFNNSVAKGFTFIENMANEVIDLFDANALQESLLVYLSNLFNLKLKSDDPTLWRRQIKEAIPVFKMKGTLPGLKAAFAEAGMDLQRFTQYWQIVSPYTWVETFTASDSETFTLFKPGIILPLDMNNTGLWLKRAGTSDFVSVPTSYVSFDAGDDGVVRMTWVASNLSNNSVDLFDGDQIKVMYQYNVIPGPTEQQLENYIRSLPLADQRDENAQAYPLKNWNVKLIAEEDPLFPILVPVRHPFADPLIFGWVRTEFAYSENIYNMEEYNGSTRPSNDPCNIDKDFVDPCGACLSSLYTVDIGVQELCNDRMLEAQEILREYTPFHAQVHSLNFTGEVNEFVPSPVETITSLITIDYSQFILSGESNPFFTRFMPGGLSYAIVDREMLTDEVTVLTGESGTAFNERVSFVSPDFSLESLGLSSLYHILEVFAPSPNAGNYTLGDISGRTARVATVVPEPVDESTFTFRLSNIVYANGYTNIKQDNLFVLTDENVDFDAIGVKTLWDVEHTHDYTGGSWTITIPAYSATPYQIVKVVGESLYLNGDSLLPSTSHSGLTYRLSDDQSNVIASSSSGDLTVSKRGYVDLNDLTIINISDITQVGDYLYYAGAEYRILEFDGHNFWIDGYDAGNVAGVSIQIRRRLIDQGIGVFNYSGLSLTTVTNLETTLGIINGGSPPPEDQQTDNNLFKENFLIHIGGDFYKISDINGTKLVLAGRLQDWTTQSNGGTPVTFNVVHFPAKTVNVGFTVFDMLNRNGKDPVIREIESDVDNTIAIVALSASPSSGLEEHMSHNEGISFVIERRNGDISEGEI